MEGPEQHQHQETHIGKGRDKDSTSVNSNQPPKLDSNNNSVDNTAQGPCMSEPQSLDQRPGSRERALSNGLSKTNKMNILDEGQQGQVKPG